MTNLTPPQTSIVTSQIALLRQHEKTGDRDHNLHTIALVLGAVFAFMTRHMNKSDCVEVVAEAQRRIGWTS